MAISPPTLAKALLSPEASPVWSVLTEVSTAVVRGATAQAMPSDITSMAGSVVVQ